MRKKIHSGAVLGVLFSSILCGGQTSAHKRILCLIPRRKTIRHPPM